MEILSSLMYIYLYNNNIENFVVIRNKIYILESLCIYTTGEAGWRLKSNE